MPGIIEELQRGALDPATPVDALLRRIQLAAAKLQLHDVESWVRNELNGYEGELPAYRKPLGQLRGWNPYHGWVPVQIDLADLAEMVSTAHIYQSVGTLVDLASRDGGALHFPLHAGLVGELNKIMNVASPRYIIQLSRGNVVGILDRVRNLVLDWAIRMEQEGIVGEGISFSEAEKAQARQAVTNIHIGSIGNMAGHIGEGNEGDVRATQTANDVAVFHALAEVVRAGISATEDREKLLAAIDALESSSGDKGAFGAAYAKFISTAADYMSLVSPFLPALAQMMV